MRCLTPAWKAVYERRIAAFLAGATRLRLSGESCRNGFAFANSIDKLVGTSGYLSPQLLDTFVTLTQPQSRQR